MPAHDLQHERPRVRDGGGVDVINRLADPVQRRRRTDGQVRHGHVVVDRPDEPDDAEVRVLLGFFGGDLSCVGGVSAVVLRSLMALSQGRRGGKERGQCVARSELG